MVDPAGAQIPALHLNQRFRLLAEFEVLDELDDAVVEFGISTFGGDRIVTVQSSDGARPPLGFRPGRRSIWAELHTSLLPGQFTVDVAIHHANGVTVDHVQDAMRFTALNAAEAGDDHYPWSVVRGYVRPGSVWSEVDAVELAGHGSDSTDGTDSASATLRRN
jgi:hypothetical protein